MTREQVQKIIEEEGLIWYNFFENRSNKEYEEVIVKDGNQWRVYSTDERASLWGVENIYDNESDALERFVEKLRLAKSIRKRRNDWLNKEGAK